MKSAGTDVLNVGVPAGQAHAAVLLGIPPNRAAAARIVAEIDWVCRRDVVFYSTMFVGGGRLARVCRRVSTR